MAWQAKKRCQIVFRFSTGEDDIGLCTGLPNYGEETVAQSIGDKPHILRIADDQFSAGRQRRFRRSLSDGPTKTRQYVCQPRHGVGLRHGHHTERSANSLSCHHFENSHSTKVN